MEKITAIVDPVTMLFCDDGMAEGRIVVEVPYNPDVKKECYSGDPKNPDRRYRHGAQPRGACRGDR